MYIYKLSTYVPAHKHVHTYTYMCLYTNMHTHKKMDSLDHACRSHTARDLQKTNPRKKKSGRIEALAHFREPSIREHDATTKFLLTLTEEPLVDAKDSCIRCCRYPGFPVDLWSEPPQFGSAEEEQTEGTT